MSSMFLLLVLLAFYTDTTASSQIGDHCEGYLLADQTASTSADHTDVFTFAFSGDVGDVISCVKIQPANPMKEYYRTRDGDILAGIVEGSDVTETSLLRGGPKQRYVVLEIRSANESEAQFNVKVFGTKQSLRRRRRADDSPTTTTTTTKPPPPQNPISSAARQLTGMIKSMREFANRLESVQKVLMTMSEPFGP